MSDLTDRAEQLLEGITPGKWDFNEWPDQTTIDNGEGVVVAALPSCLRTNSEADTRFIAAAPQLVADLLAEVKRLTPRAITSVEEVRAMPVGSIILDAERIVMERVAEILGDCWVMTEETGRVGHVYVELPARVLYVPEVRS